MHYELGIGPSAEFADVHALAVAVGVYPLLDEGVQQEIQAVDQGQHEAEQRGDADDLGEKLTPA